MPSDAPIRLATIVGVDVVGYSARTEADAQASAREIATLRARLGEIAVRHGGRIFNTAGDAVMMEFAAAGAAIAAIFDLLDERPADEPALRVGAHLGDVSVADNGDLLGHGVNVVARLIALAAPGVALISGELRAMSGGATRPMRSVGEVSLAKMAAKVMAYEIAPAPKRGPGGAAADLSIAVLPFVNMSSDPEQEYFSDGLTEELINQLAQIKALRVAGRTSSFAFKGKLEDLKIIGEKLGVAYVLEGSVRKAGAHLRITAQLIACGDGFHLWSDKFDRELTDVFAIQDEIAGAVAEILKVTLGVSGTSRVPGGTENLEAFDLMLRARALNRSNAAGGPARARALMREAITLDPNFALGWSVLGNTIYAHLVMDVGDRGALRSELDQALENAMRLAPDLWTAHEARANLLELRRDWVGAEQANAKSRALAPKSMREPVVSRAHQLAIVGRPSEGLPFAYEASRIEPLSPNFSIQNLAMLAGRFEEAELAYESGKDLPRLDGLDELFAAFRMMAIGEHARAKERLATGFTSIVAQFPTLSGVVEAFDDPAAARASVAKAIEGLDDKAVGLAPMYARFAAYVGEPEMALVALRRAAPHLLGVQITNIWDLGLAPVRKLPGFKDFVRELNLVAYWRTTGQWGEFARPLGDDDFEIVR
jgi:adenylate cyclase